MRKRVDDSMYNIGSNIRTARKRADLTQEKMSELIGVTPQYLSDLERGLVGTSIATLIRICTELNVSADFILFGKSDEEVVEEVRAKFMSKCVNQVTTGIQPTIFKITVDNQKRIQEKIQAELVSKMEKVKAGLREKMDDANKSKEEVEAEISKLTSAISHLNTIISEI